MKALKVTAKTKVRLPLFITFGTIVIGLLAFLSNLLGRPFNSDDVAEQSMAHNLLTSPPHSLLIQIDTYIIKYPIYWLIGISTHPSVTQIEIESFLFNLLMIILLWVWWRNFSPSIPMKWLVFAWLLASGTYWMSKTANPNTRNLEIPLMLLIGFFVTFHLEKLKKYDYKLSRGLVIYAVGLAIITGLLIFNDPYLLFFILLPLILTTLIHAKRKNDLWPVLFVALGLTISIIVFKLLEIVSSHLGINLTKFNEINDLGSSTVSLRYLPSKVLYTLGGYLSLFGVNATSVSISPWRFLAGLPGLSIILLAIWEFYNIIHKRIFSLFNLWIIMVFIFTFFYVIITGTLLFNTLRYLIILVPLTVLLALNGLVELQKRSKQLYMMAI